MKRRILTCLLAALMLVGCNSGTTEKGPAAGEMSIPESPYGAETGTVYLLKPEWEVYDPSVEQVWFTLENHSGKEVETGVDYALETLHDNGGWYQVPFRENVGWTAEAICLQDGGTLVLSCWLPMFDYDFRGGGTYRIVKQVGDEVAMGQFRMAEGAAISAETPYGYGPLEELSENDTPAPAAASAGQEASLTGGVLFNGEGSYGTERVATFLEKVRLGIPCQLRTFQDYGQGTLMAIDVIYENDHFLWRMWQEGSVTEQRFSYLVTDGAALYLSNGADWENTLAYNSSKAFLVPEGECQDLIPALEQTMADRLEWNITRCKVWSTDGVWCAGLSDSEFSSPGEFFVSWQKQGEGSGGSTYDLQSWDGLETAITAMEWREDGTLKLACKTLEGGTSVLYFHPETEALTSIP